MRFADILRVFKAMTALSDADIAAREEIGGLFANLDFLLAAPPQPEAAPGIPPPPPLPTFKPGPVFDNSAAFLTSPAGDGIPSLEFCIRLFDRQPSRETYLTLHRAILGGFERCRQGAAGHERHRVFLEWLVGRLEAEAGGLFANVVLGAPGNQYLMALGPSFQAACRLACLDATGHQQFVNPDLMVVVRNRALAMGAAPPPQATRIPLVALLGTADVFRLGPAIRAYGGAECYGLAVVAAWLIASAPVRGTIEIVSNCVHKWVRFTDRNGATIFVDLWLGTVGNAVFYPGGVGYPFQHDRLETLFSVTKT